jgi:hypothetical protein
LGLPSEKMVFVVCTKENWCRCHTGSTICTVWYKNASAVRVSFFLIWSFSLVPIIRSKGKGHVRCGLVGLWHDHG